MLIAGAAGRETLTSAEVKATQRAIPEKAAAVIAALHRAGLIVAPSQSRSIDEMMIVAGDASTIAITFRSPPHHPRKVAVTSP
jgi:hypothetical protein